MQLVTDTAYERRTTRRKADRTYQFRLFVYFLLTLIVGISFGYYLAAQEAAAIVLGK